MPTRANDEADIRRRIDQAVEAIRAMDLEALMPIYDPDIVSFDIEPPLQHLGAQAKRTNWTKVFTIYQRPLGYEVRDLAITAGNDVAFVRMARCRAGRALATGFDGRRAGARSRVTGASCTTRSRCRSTSRLAKRC
jgi:ketosteroid isomerase-like protein